MNTRIYLAILFLLIGAASVQAQSFIPNISNSKKNTEISKPQSDKVISAPSLVMEAKPAIKVQQNVKNSEDETSVFMKKSVKNIGNFNQSISEKKYDNSQGKVVVFRLKDGKLEFDDNKERKILVWYEDFNVIKGMDGMVRCSVRVNVFNDLTTRISSLGFKLIWPNISTSISMDKVNPGVTTYLDTMLLGEGCFTMDKTPVIEVNRCRVKGMKEEECADAVHWYDKR